MRKRFAVLITASVLAVFVVAATPPATTPLAKIKNAGDALAFYPTQEAREFVLTISGPCGYQQRETFSTSEIVFRLPKDALDGSYIYSLDAMPIIDPEVMKILRATREIDENGRRRELCRAGKLPVAQNQSGGFSVVDGKIVIDTTPESEREKRDAGR